MRNIFYILFVFIIVQIACTTTTEQADNNASSYMSQGAAFFEKGNQADKVEERIQFYKVSLEQFVKAQEGYDNKSPDAIKSPVYHNALKMEAAAMSELYKLNAVPVKDMLDTFRVVLRESPNNKYIQDFMAYLNNRRGATYHMMRFYRDVVTDIMIPYAEKKDSMYNETALKYINLGLCIGPNDQVLLPAAVKVYNKLGKPEKANEYQSRF